MIFLSILKIIGIVLACVVALVLLIALLLLVIPFRYKIFAKGHNLNSNVIASVKWFFGIIHLEFSYVESEFDLFFKIFGKNIYLRDLDDNDDKKSKVEIKANNIEKKSSSNSSVQVKVRPSKKKKEKLSFKQRIIKLLEKIKDFFIKLKNIKYFATSESTKRAIKHIKKIIFNLIKHIFPKKIIGNLQYGIYDPAITALTYGAFATYLEQSQKGKLLITPDFEENGVFLDLKIYGRLFAGYVLISYLRLILNKDYKKMVDAKRRLF